MARKSLDGQPALARAGQIRPLRGLGYAEDPGVLSFFAILPTADFSENSGPEGGWGG